MVAGAPPPTRARVIELRPAGSASALPTTMTTTSLVVAILLARRCSGRCKRVRGGGGGGGLHMKVNIGLGRN